MGKLTEIVLDHIDDAGDEGTAYHSLQVLNARRLVENLVTTVLDEALDAIRQQYAMENPDYNDGINSAAFTVEYLKERILKDEGITPPA